MTLTEYRLIFRQQYPALTMYATKLLGDADVEDVVQDAFMELWRRRDVIVDDTHIKSFLWRTVYTRSLNVIKHRHIVFQHEKAYVELERQRMAYYEPSKNLVDNDMRNKELHAQIDAAIATLPDKCRQVFMMSYLHDMSSKEIAQVLAISVRTVDVHLYKALRLLRTKLAKVALLILLKILIA